MDIVELGINKIAILDDDIKFNYSYNSISEYVDNDCLDSLSDINSPSREELVNLLESLSLPASNVNELVESFNNSEVINSLPEYYLEGIIEPIEERNKDLREKINLVIDCLKELGVSDENIFSFHDVSGISNCDEDIDLYIVDLFLEEGNIQTSINYLKGILESSKENNNQFILMSYDKEQLDNQFRSQHIESKISSSQLKVIEKPHSLLDKEKTRWLRAIQQIALERALIDYQRNMQNKWTDLVEKASKEFINKIWSLDNFAINKLRLTANADDMSLSDYLATAMHRALLAELEVDSSHSNITFELEKSLKSNDDQNKIVPSNEVLDSYQILTEFVADLTSYRVTSLKQLSCSESDEGLAYNNFLSSLSYGSILKKSGDNKNYYLHITQPCDYIHINLQESINNNLFLIPGRVFSNFGSHMGGNKKYLSSFINTETGVHNIDWNLRQIETISIKKLFEDRALYNVVGRLRDEEVQTISHQFGSSMSRIATNRKPWFDYINCKHVYLKHEDNEYKFFYFDNEHNLKTLDNVSIINNATTDSISYKHHIDKIQARRSEQYIIKTELDSIPDIIESLSTENYEISVIDYPDKYVLDEYNICDHSEHPISVIFFKDFKLLFNNKSTNLSERYSSMTERHFLVIM